MDIQLGDDPLRDALYFEADIHPNTGQSDSVVKVIQAQIAPYQSRIEKLEKALKSITQPSHLSISSQIVASHREVAREALKD